MINKFKAFSHTQFTQTNWAAIAVAVFIVIVTYSSNCVPVLFGIDPPWMYALNYLHLNHTIATKYFAPFGPLGFLLWTNPIANNILIAVIFWLSVRLILALAMLKLFFALKQQRGQNETIANIIIGMLFFGVFIGGYGYLVIFFAVITFILLFNINKNNSRFLHYAILLAVINFLISPVYAAASFAAIFTYVIIYCIYYRTYRIALAVLLNCIISYCALWILLNHTYVGLINYLVINYEFISGNPTAMSLYPSNNWYYLFFALLTFLGAFWVFRGKEFFAKTGQIIPALFLLPLFIAFKYAYGREDCHLFFMDNFLLLTFIYWIFIATLEVKKAVSVVVLGFCTMLLVHLNEVQLGNKFDFVWLNVSGMANLNTQLLHHSQYKASLLQLSENRLNKHKMPFRLRKLIGNATVDVYPDNLTVVVANSCNWQPRTVLQALTAYTPFLDELNAAFFKDESKAPKFIIWISELFTDDLVKLDRKYFLNGEPDTIYQIFNWYKMVAFESSYGLFERQPLPQLKAPYVIRTETAKWNEWITTPSINKGILRAHIYTKATFLGKLKVLLYKQGNVLLDYKLKDGSIVTQRIVLPTAEHGVWVSPYVSNLSQLFKTKPNVAAIRLHYSADDFFRDRIVIIWDVVVPN